MRAYANKDATIAELIVAAKDDFKDDFERITAAMDATIADEFFKYDNWVPSYANPRGPTALLLGKLRVIRNTDKADTTKLAQLSLLALRSPLFS